MDDLIFLVGAVLWLILVFFIGRKAKKNGRLRLYVVSLIVYIICSILVYNFVYSIELLFFALILTPLAGGAILLIVGKKKEQQPVYEDDTKKCPFCAEIIKKDALVCRFCGKEISSQKTKPSVIKKLSNSISTEIKADRKSLFLFLSCVFMLVPVILSLFTYTGIIDKSFLFIVHYKKKITASIQPQLLSTILAVVLYSSLLIRGIIQTNFKTEKNVVLGMDLLLHCLNVLFIASFLKIFFDEEPIKWLPIDISPMVILVFGILISWIGMKTIAGYVWVILFIMAMTKLTQIDHAMGGAGTIYVLSAFLSILCQLIPNGKFASLAQTFNSDFKVAKAEIQEDLQAAKETTEKLVKSASGIPVNRNLPKEGEEPVLVTDEKSD